MVARGQTRKKKHAEKVTMKYTLHNFMLKSDLPKLTRYIARYNILSTKRERKLETLELFSKTFSKTSHSNIDTETEVKYTYTVTRKHVNSSPYL